MSYETTRPAGARELLAGEDGWAYIDVRTVEEFEAGHAEGAFNIPVATRAPSGGMLPNPDFVAVVQKHFAPDAALVLGCAMGGRSARACEALEAAGHTRLVNMYGGFNGASDAMGTVVEPGWQACGYPCEAASPPERSYDGLRA